MSNEKAQYRVSFTYREKHYELRAAEIEYDHPYFVTLEGLVFDSPSELLVTPEDDASRKAFGEYERITLPVQSVELISELRDTRGPHLKAVPPEKESGADRLLLFPPRPPSEQRPD